MESECECCGEISNNYYLGVCTTCIKSIPALKAENAKLRELIAQCADDFEAAADGSGVNFYQCAVDLRTALLGGEE